MKKNIYRLNYLLAVSVFLAVLNACAKNEEVLHIPSQFDQIKMVNYWQVIGPFKFDTISQTPESAIFNLDLDKYGIDENDFTLRSFEELEKQDIIIKNVSSENGFIEYLDFTDSTQHIKTLSSFYAYARIYSEKDRELIMIADGSNSYKIWINQSLVLEERKKVRNENAGNRFVRVSLKKGMNDIFAKVSRSRNIYNWKLLVGFAEKPYAEYLFRNNYHTQFIVNPFIRDSLIIYTGHLIPTDVKITDPEGIVLIQESISNSNSDGNIMVSGLNKLKTGFYDCALSFDFGTMNQIFYKGEYEELFNGFDAMGIDITTKMDTNDLNANLHRIWHLKSYTFHDTTSVSERTFIDNNRVFWAYNLKTYYDMIMNGTCPSEIPGTRMMTYQHDGNVKHFMFHTGSKVLNQTSMPLVIIVPFPLTGETFMEDWYMGLLSQIRNDSKLADEFGFGLVWLFMEGKNYTLQAGHRDALLAIERLRNHWNIDTNAIFLMGECEGGRRALDLAALEPTLFSGIAMSSAPLISNNSNLIFDNLDRFVDIPLHLTHGYNDTETPVTHSRIFVKEAVKYGLDIEYVETDNGHYTVDRGYRRGMFEFFNRIRKKSENKNIIH